MPVAASLVERRREQGQAPLGTRQGGVGERLEAILAYFLGFWRRAAVSTHTADQQGKSSIAFELQITTRCAIAAGAYLTDY